MDGHFVAREIVIDEETQPLVDRERFHERPANPHGHRADHLALWLGHESIETTQIYLDADLELKQRVLDTVTPLNGKSGRYRPDDKLPLLKSL
jgi:hypothetical protein